MISNNSSDPLKPWTTEEIIDHAESWNLSGDIGLLNTLQSFANNLYAKSAEVNAGFNTLNKNLDSTKLKLKFARNKLHSLRNKQFIESRVYEDDETLPLENDNSIKKEETTKVRDKEKHQKELLDFSHQMLAKYFEKVQVEVSDSEDEDEVPKTSFVYRRKDLYIHRPLPYQIGSDEWNKKWHVGLKNSPSESSSEEISEKFSDSEDEGFSANMGSNAQSSQFLDIDSVSEQQFSTKSEVGQNAYGENVQTTFAEQLAQKLGNIINENSYDSDVNTRPMAAASHFDPYGDLFSQEPPPLLDNPKRDLFSVGGSIFDKESDSDDAKSDVVFPKKTVKDLFDESSEEELFIPKKTILFDNNKPKPSFINSEPPALIPDPKKPIGGVSVFGNAINESKLFKARANSEESDGSESDIFKTENSIKTANIKDTQSLLKNTPDSKSDDLFKVDKFVEKKVENTHSTGFKDDLFGDIDDEANDIFSTGLFATNPKKLSLFDDATTFKSRLFSDSDAIPDNETKSVNITKKGDSSPHDYQPSKNDVLPEKVDDIFGDKFRTSDLFEDLNIVKKKKSGLFDDNSNTSKPDFKSQLFSETDENQEKDTPVNIFQKNVFKEETSSSKIDNVIVDPISINSSPPEIVKNAKITTLPGKVDDLFGEEFKTSDLFDDLNNVKLKDSGLFDDISNKSKTDFKSRIFSENDNNSEEATKPVNVTQNSESTNINIPQKIVDQKQVDSSPPSNAKNDFFGDAFKTTDSFDSLKLGGTVESNAAKQYHSPLFEECPPEDEWDFNNDNQNQKSSFLKDEDDDLFDFKNDNFITKSDTNDNFDDLFGSPPRLSFQEPIKQLENPEQSQSDDIKNLQRKLNINVAHLLPGAIPEINDNNNAFESVASSDILRSVTKNRAQKPVNRRPSTRKGRQTALKDPIEPVSVVRKPENVPKDGVFGDKDAESGKIKNKPIGGVSIFGKDITENKLFKARANPEQRGKDESGILNTERIFEEDKKDNLLQNTLFSDTTDNKDLFNFQQQTKESFVDKNEEVVESKVKQKKPVKSDQSASEIFETQNSSKKVDEPEQKVAKNTNNEDLFNLNEHKDFVDEIEAKVESKVQQKAKESIFSDSDSEPENIMSSFISKSKKSGTNTSKKSKKLSLFGDDDSDDDNSLFNSSSAASSSTSQKKNVEKKAVTERKSLTKSKPVVDPLSALLDE